MFCSSPSRASPTNAADTSASSFRRASRSPGVSWLTGRSPPVSTTTGAEAGSAQARPASQWAWTVATTSLMNTPSA